MGQGAQRGTLPQGIMGYIFCMAIMLIFFQ
jgi:hypothetical protein